MLKAKTQATFPGWDGRMCRVFFPDKNSNQAPLRIFKTQKLRQVDGQVTCLHSSCRVLCALQEVSARLLLQSSGQSHCQDADMIAPLAKLKLQKFHKLQICNFKNGINCEINCENELQFAK